MEEQRYKKLNETDNSVDLKSIETEPSHLEFFLKMLRLSEYCTDFEVTEDTRLFQGDNIPVVVVSYLDGTNRPISAIFLKSTEELLLFESGVEIIQIEHHH